MTASEEFARLVCIMHRLRQQCPWDRSQNHATLRAYLLEETYEVLHSLDEEHYVELREELGDLLLQVVFHAEIAREGGRFDIADVLRCINEKLVRRHPHVFGDKEARTPAEVLRRWEDIKTSQEQKPSFLDGVPDALPALLRAVRVLDKITQSGADPFSAKDVAAEAARWLDNLCSAATQENAQDADRAAGMLCLAVAELTRQAHANAEDAVRKRVTRLVDAFQKEEARLRRQGRRFADLSEDELDRVSACLLSACEED